ncbi:Hsp20/alpha crystallin family protein [Methylophaga nitratireducenticrescens]|jgi:HSP20 family protein|uniref:Heat shock protein Hsp20 n=1 Tax=Methylophaga nitratireducenticrescens TaxID=754476 RepID=I1XJ12_METNJ|nr:Hsp20/alpha crystallin family protein [Methylophaga nitratireducenticrescens]AFI84381.1 heat-shock protein Hsp20 [Methylophaga nitratireducenticrescens]AUZ84453.1 heat-shock protein Hsp20 [Methylophaga nitratireducenticrescens]
MAIQRYRPYSLLDNLQREMSSLFQSPAVETNFSEEDWTPAVDIQENAESYIIHADLPGVKAADIEVTAENGLLTIKGVRDSKKVEEKDNYKRIERFSGSFMRRFTLPETADVDNINAASRDGVLELTIPKMPQLQPKRIEVNVQQ